MTVINDNAKEQIFILHFCMSLTNCKMVLIPLKPRKEQTIPKHFTPIAGIAQIKQDFMVRLKKFVDNSKNCSFNLWIMAAFGFFYLPNNKLVGNTTRQYNIFPIKTYAVMNAKICPKQKIIP